MSHSTPDPRARFTHRVADYVLYRPRYPDALAEMLVSATGLSTDDTIADVGSGTGISSRLLLRTGCTVVGVEPNEAMRKAAELDLGGEAGFRSIAGSAEETTLGDASVDLVAAGQAFHWFDHSRARKEFVRILRAPRPVALFWNDRLLDADQFSRDYERLLRTYGTDYAEVHQQNVDRNRIREFYRGGVDTYTFPNEQLLDLVSLRGRVLSASYAPPPGHPLHEPMLQELRRLFERHQEDGRVRILYETRLHVGHLSP